MPCAEQHSKAPGQRCSACEGAGAWTRCRCCHCRRKRRHGMQKAPAQSLRRRLPGSHRLHEGLHSQRARHSGHRSRREDGSLPPTMPRSTHHAPPQTQTLTLNPPPDGTQCRQRQPSRPSCHRNPSGTIRCSMWRALRRDLTAATAAPAPVAATAAVASTTVAATSLFVAEVAAAKAAAATAAPAEIGHTLWMTHRCAGLYQPETRQDRTRSDRAELKDGIGACEQRLTPHLRLPPPPPPKPPPREASEDSQPGSSCFVSCACPRAACC